MTRMKPVTKCVGLGLLAIGIWWTPAPLAAQEGPFAFQLRAGGTVPVGSFGDDAQGWEGEAGQGTSLSMGFTFPLFPFVGGYVGFSQYRFACDTDVCAKGKDWFSTGFDLALRAVAGSGKVRPWLQAGFHNHRVEGRVLEGGRGRGVNSDGGGGYELGGGSAGGGGGADEPGPGRSIRPGQRALPGPPEHGAPLSGVGSGLGDGVLRAGPETVPGQCRTRNRKGGPG